MATTLDTLPKVGTTASEVDLEVRQDLRLRRDVQGTIILHSEMLFKETMSVNGEKVDLAEGDKTKDQVGMGLPAI